MTVVEVRHQQRGGDFSRVPDGLGVRAQIAEDLDRQPHGLLDEGADAFLGIALLINLGSYFFSDKLALKMSRAQPIDESEAPRLYEIVRELVDPNRYELFAGQHSMLKAMGQPYSELGRVRIVDTRGKMAVAGVGAWEPEQSTLYDATSEAERAEHLALDQREELLGGAAHVGYFQFAGLDRPCRTIVITSATMSVRLSAVSSV